MTISNRDREILLRQINRLLLDTPTFEVGDVARVIENAGTSLSKGSIATVTKVLTDDSVSVTTRRYDGQESFGVIPNNQLQKVSSLGVDIDSNEVNLYDFIEGVEEFPGQLFLVTGVDSDGCGIANPVKLRIDPVVETHVDAIIRLEGSKLTTLDEWRKTRVGDIVEFKDMVFDEYFDVYNERGDYAVVTDVSDGGIYVTFSEWSGIRYEDTDSIKTVLRK